MLGTALAILGAIFASIIGLIGNRDGSSKERKLLAGVILFAGAVSCIGAMVAFHDTQVADQRIANLQASSDTAKRTLTTVQGTLKTANQTLESANRAIGELAVLDKLGNGGAYYVQIAADTVPDRLQPTALKMEANFGGQNASQFICIAYPKSDSSQYLLLFGHGVSLASAEVFMRIANLKGFSNGAPEIHLEAPEDRPRCWAPPK